MATITGATPNPVEVGQPLTISGTGLDTATRVVFVSRGGRGVTSAAPTTVSATSVQVTVPLNAKSGIFYVVTSSGNIVGPSVTINDPLGANPQNNPQNQSLWGRINANPYVSAFTRPLQKYIGPASLGTAVAGVHVSGNYGEKIASDIVRGALAVPREALAAGFKIGMMLVDGVLSVFGASGSAMSRLISGVGSGLQKLLEGGLSIAGKGLAGVGKIVGAGAGAVGALGGAAVGAMFGFPGALVGAAIGAGIVTGILKAVEGLAGAVAGILEGVAKTFGILAEVAGTMIQSLIDIVKDGVDTAMQKARGILQLSQATGWSVGESSRATQIGQAFGIGANQLPRQNAFFAGALGSLYGGDGSGSKDDVRAYRENYRQYADQGPLGLMLAQIYEGVSNKGAYREAVNYDDALFEKQLARSSSLEMSGESVNRFGQEFKSLLDTVAMLAENVKVTIGEAFLPLLQEGLDAAVNYWLENRETIVDTIFEIGRWFYAELPGYLIKGFDIIVAGGAGFLRWLGGLAKSYADTLRGFEKGSGGFLEIFVPIATGIDFLSVALKGVSTLFVHVGGLINNVGFLLAQLWQGFSKFILWLSDGIHSIIALIPGLGDSKWAQEEHKSIKDQLANATTSMKWVSGEELFKITDNIPTSDLTGMIENMRNGGKSGILAKSADALDGAAKSLNDSAKGVDKWRETTVSAMTKAIGTPEERRKDYDEQTKLLRDLAASNREIAGNTKPKPSSQNGAVAAENMLARIIAYMNEDAYLQNGR